MERRKMGLTDSERGVYALQYNFLMSDRQNDTLVARTDIAKCCSEFARVNNRVYFVVALALARGRFSATGVCP